MGRSFRIIVLGLLFLTLGAPVRGQTIAVQVSDVENHPLPGVVLSVANGSTGAATDVAVKTQLIPPNGIQPGDPILLILVSGTKLVFFSPWHGHALTPTPKGFIAVVLGALGNIKALNNRRVVVSMMAAVNQRNDAHRAEWWSFSGPSSIITDRTLNSVAKDSGFSASQVDGAIRTFLKDPGDIQDATVQKLGAAYLADYPTPRSADIPFKPPPAS